MALNRFTEFQEIEWRRRYAKDRAAKHYFIYFEMKNGACYRLVDYMDDGKDRSRKSIKI